MKSDSQAATFMGCVRQSAPQDLELLRKVGFKRELLTLDEYKISTL
jgi:hypothetical protein